VKPNILTDRQDAEGSPEALEGKKKKEGQPAQGWWGERGRGKGPASRLQVRLLTLADVRRGGKMTKKK